MVIREANESNDQSPSTPQETPVDQPVEQPNTPTDNGGNVYTPAPPIDNDGGSVAVTPEQPSPTPPPVDNGGGNSGGSTGGGNTVVPSEPTPDNEPAGRISPWFMSYAEALAWSDNLPDEQFDRSGIAGSSFSDGSVRYCVVLN